MNLVIYSISKITTWIETLSDHYQHLLPPHPINILEWWIRYIRIQIHLVILSYGITRDESPQIRRLVSCSHIVVTCIILELSSCVESCIGIHCSCVGTQWSESASRVDIGFTMSIVGILLYYESCTRGYRYNRTLEIGVVIIPVCYLSCTRKTDSFFVVICKYCIGSDTVEIVLFKGQW